MNLFRYKIIIQYDGSDYHGWQIQKNHITIQSEIENALMDLISKKITITGSGRTDAGVHALGQVAHFDLNEKIDPKVIMNALNAKMNKDIRVISCTNVNSNFHARFSAKLRHYEYKIINRRQPLTLEKDLFWRVGRPLNEEHMQKGANFLIGTYDFTTFRSINCQSKSPIKSLESIKIERKKDKVLFFISAKSYLHNQLRSIVGSLKLVGEGKWHPEKINQILAQLQAPMEIMR